MRSLSNKLSGRRARRADVVGLIPAGGSSNRISPLPCSKEIFPVGFRQVDNDVGPRPKVACHYLLEKMRTAGITKVYIVLRQGKWDIPAYLGDGTLADVHLAYLTVGMTSGPPFTLDQAYPFVCDSVVAFGFPDIIFQTRDPFVQLLKRREATGADIVLGLFSIDRSQRDDRVIVGKDGKVQSFIAGPTNANVSHTWNIAVWGPSFTGFMHQHLTTIRRRNLEVPPSKRSGPSGEITVGAVIKAAFDRGLRVAGVLFRNDPYIDIGTPGGLLKAINCYIDRKAN